MLFQDSVVIAADIDTKAVRDARRSLSDSRIDFVICDASHLPFIEGSFDFVTCRRFLMNLKRKKNALLQMKFALRTGGVFCAVEHSFLDSIESSTLPSELRFSRKLMRLTLSDEGNMPDMGFGRKLSAQIQSCGFSSIGVMVAYVKKQYIEHGNSDSDPNAALLHLKESLEWLSDSGNMDSLAMKRLREEAGH